MSVGTANPERIDADATSAVVRPRRGDERDLQLLFSKWNYASQSV